jgi:hypothetical protein
MIQKFGIFKKRIKNLTVEMDFWRHLAKASRKEKYQTL